MKRRVLLHIVLFVALAVSSVDIANGYTKVNATGTRLEPNTFEAFNPGKVPGAIEEPRPAFKATFTYGGRDWEVYSEPRKPSRRPIDPKEYQRTVLVHRSVPAVLAISFEQVEAAADADPATLAKILRYNREANANFKVLNEAIRSLAGVEGTQTEYVQPRKKKLLRVRHWIAQFNGVVYQMELMVPYDHPELLDVGGPTGFPVLLEFFEHARNRPLLKDADIPRTFASSYGYRIDLGDGDWIPDAHDPYIGLAEYVAYTRNQGGIAVVPFSTMGQDVDPDVLLNAMVWLGELPTRDMLYRPERVINGKLQGITFETMSGDEEQMIRMQTLALCSSNYAYLAVAWINTNTALGPEVLQQWLSKVSFAPDTAHLPANPQALTGLRERDRQAMGFLGVGEYYSGKKDLDKSAAALQMAMECRFLPQILAAFARCEYRRGHPEEIVNYLKSRGPTSLKQGWVALELAFAESHSGDAWQAAAHYSQCIASGGYSVGDFPPDYFEDFIRCLIKIDRANWASDRLKQRIAVDSSPVWQKMLAELKQSRAVAPGAISTASSSIAGTSTAAPAPLQPTGPPHLKNIIWNPGMPSAQLDQNLVFEGDRVRGYKVVKIRQDSVDVVTPDGKPLTLHSKS